MREQNRNETVRCPRQGEFYQHFKHKLYQILTIAQHTQTGEELVIYQALYDDFRVFARPLSSFVSEVDHDKYPEATQRYRFELWDKDVIHNAMPSAENVSQVEHKEQTDREKEFETKKKDYLMDFLDAKTCKEKLELFEQFEKFRDEHILNSMAVSLDLPILEEDYEQRKDGIRDYLLARVRFESNRLR